tara:strand:- start:137554 stop:137727 length:174 start_codon:yes stop_codon:yes gene_type:complete
MSYKVTVKIGDYMESFHFDSNDERSEFIEITRDMNPKVQVITEEEDSDSVQMKYSTI